MSESDLFTDVERLTAQMCDSGIRRLLVIAGERHWSYQQAQGLAARLAGDWLWTGEGTEWPVHCAPVALRTLLGQEFQHAVFDARTGLDATALAALAGTLKAGSWLVLLTPDWQRWPTLPDADSCRWSDTPEAIATPHFITWLQSCVVGSPDAVVWRQNCPLRMNNLPDYPQWHPVNQGPQQEQAELLTQLVAMEKGVAVVTSARGRGKSSLAGMLVSRSPGRCLVSAPAKAATDVLAKFAGERFHFIAPDALILDKPEGDFDWLIIDEAAAIPAPLLQQMIASFPRVLLTTTVQGYEGTGRGFLLKFCASLPSYHAFTLNTPARWAENDPLERLIDRIMLFDEPDLEALPAGSVQFSVIDTLDWPRNARQLADMYRLLSGAHYRTSPLDWRRLLDAPGMHYLAATIEQRCAGALWLVEEGGLSSLLSQQVWAGFRRPRGNLVAQSLAAHGGSPLAATLRGLRVSRIAVHPSHQRQRLGSELMQQALPLAQGQYDYLSVSFGYTEALWRFWQRCGFKLVRIGTQREASSGCYTAMALLPLSEAGTRLTDAEQQRLFRDSRGYPQLPVDILSGSCTGVDDSLNESDWLALAGFAFAHRPLDCTCASLHRLLQACEYPSDLLRGQLQKGYSNRELCQLFNLTGRKALLSAQRLETETALMQLDSERCEALRLWIQQIRPVASQ